MAVKKKFPIKIGFNLEDVRRDLQETKDILREKERLEQSGALPKSITSKQDKNKNQRTQLQGGRGLHKDKKSKSSTAGITSDSIITKLQNQIRDIRQKQKDETSQRKDDYKKFTAKIKEQKQQDKLLDKQIDELQENALHPFMALKKRGTQALRAIIPLAFIFEITDLILDRIRKEFGAGGRLDLRKLVLNAVTEFLQIPHRIQRDRGEVYFASQHSSSLYQGAPGISNTERIVDGHLRDLLIDPGR